MYDVRMTRSLTLTMIMLLSALSPILMPVYADHQDDDYGEGTGNGVSLSIFDNNTSSWELISSFQTQFLEEGTHEMEIRSSNLTLNDTYELTWDVSMEEYFDGGSYVEENRTWIAYNNESSESFNLTVNEFTCWIMINYELLNHSTSSTVDYGFYEFLGPCGNNGVIFTNIEIDGNDTLVESFHGPDLWDNMLGLEPGTYDMWYSTGGSGTFTSGDDYLVEWYREVSGSSNHSHTEGMYNWTAGSQSGIGLGSLGWNITVDLHTCAIMNDAMLWEAEYFADGEWDKDNSTLMGTTITDMEGPCAEFEYPDVELYYDNGSGPVMYEMAWEYEQYDSCTEFEEEDEESFWECEVDYDGDGNIDYYNGFEHCEWDNNSMTYWCEAWAESPHLEPGNYEFMANLSNLEVGADYEVYANYYLNTQDNYESNYEWFTWNNSNESHIIDGLELDINEYMCSLHIQFDIYMAGNHIMHGEFSFNGECEEMPSPFVLYYDNGTGPVMWEQAWNYEEFDNCSQYDNEHWECQVDYDNDGNTDWYNYYEHCEWDNNSMTYLCATWYDYPMLEPGDYTFTLNVSGLEIGESHELEWWINGDYDGITVNATDEYEHFEWNFTIDEYMCGFSMEFHLAHYNGMHFNDYFAFDGYCEEMPSPFELYYDNGTGPVMWEPVYNYASFDNCTHYDDGYWECAIDYDGDGYADEYYGFEHCDWDNNSMTYWCEMGWNNPMLEPGNYTFTLNVSGLEIGESHELEWWINGDYDGITVNATDEYEHFEWDVQIDEYMCGFDMEFHLTHYNGMYFNDYFRFDTYCEEPVSDHHFELYYDNGTEVVMWEPTITYEEFDNCDEYEEGHWECAIDHDGDGYIDHYAHFRDCMWDNSSMTYWCEAHHMPMLEPGEYTLILNATMLDIGTDYRLDWSLVFEGHDFYDEYMNTTWTASEEYEHFEWDIEVDESMCMLHSDLEIKTDNTNNSTYGFAHFAFNGLCEMPPQPLELYFNGMLYDGMTMQDESDAPQLEPGINYMSWDMIGLEIGDEYNLTWSTIQMGMFEEGEEEEPNIEIFAADSEEMMHDWELEIENDTCMIMIVGVLSTNYDDGSGMHGMVWAMFNGPCEIDMGDIGLEMINPVDGDWYNVEGMNGSETMQMMMMDTDSEEEMDQMMYVMENYGMDLETGDYTMRWTFEDLEVGKEYVVLMEDLLIEEEEMYYHHQNCSEEYNEEDDDWYWICEVENDDGSIDYISYEYCYEYDDGMFECEMDDDEEDVLTYFNASSDSEYYEWELTVTDDTCGHVFIIGLFDGEDGDDSMPYALSMYAIAGPNMSSCFGHEDNGPSPEDWMYMTDMDGDGNMSWDEFISFVEDDQPLDNETYELFYEFFTESDWNGDGTLDLDELSYFLPMIFSLEDDGMDVEDLMNMADYDGDGNMSWDEFYEFMYANNGGDNIDNATWNYWADFFEDSDMDSDGQLNMDELYEFWDRVAGDSDDNDWDLEDFAIEQLWSISLAYTDGVNFTYFLGATQVFDNEFRVAADMAIGDGDGELNTTEAENVYFWLIDALDQNPGGPENITLNGVPGELVFVGYDIMNLPSENGGNPSIVTAWDIHFFDVSANDDGHYEFSYMENIYDTGINTPANFCAETYEYSYQVMEFVWNGTNIDPADIGECISINVGEVVPSFSITYGQETNTDYDNDGVNNEDDAFPYDPSESMDTDGDGWGDNSDAFPNDPDEWLDTDGDGVGDNSDTDYNGDGTDDSMQDSDGDGVNDDQDDFPNDANESTDTDGDGVGDNNDVFPDDANESSDLDGDGIGDNSDDDADGDGTPNDVDAFPLTDSSNDADNDGVSNDLDAFPNNPNEYFDSDGDGVGDNADTDDDNDNVADSVDAFPYDPLETTDTDGDGLGDNADAFPNDATEKLDSDGDGVGDNADVFPSITTEWADTDGDGVGDNTDAFPNDASEIVDSDGDGVGNNADAFPYDSNEQNDSDGDGVGDNAQADQNNGGTTPVEPEPVEDDGGFLPGFSSVMGIISMLGAAILIAGRRKD